MVYVAASCLIAGIALEFAGLSAGWLDLRDADAVHRRREASLRTLMAT